MAAVARSKVMPRAIFDALLELKDAGAITADKAGQVDGADKIVDLGAAAHSGVMVVDVSAVAIDGNDELYRISLQGSTKANFADTIVELGSVELGAAEVVASDLDLETGRYYAPFVTEHGGVVYRYVRAFCETTGATVSINYTAYLTNLMSV